MEPLTAIPLEIIDAIHKKFGFVLLIKGNAGTGKTTLALEILKIAKNPIYISTRVSPEFLYEQFPWVKEFLPPSNIYDATQTYFPSLKSDKKKKFQDIHFDNVSNFIEILFEYFQQMDEPTLVIDSWDAILGYRYPETVQEEKFSNLITELVRKTNVKLILVAENPEVSFLDFMVDGLLINRDERVENRRVRVIELAKLRSIRIKQPYYAYTLESGRFKSFPSYQFQFPSILLKPDPLPDPHKNFISTGIPDLDNFLGGGLRKGSFNLIEIAPGVGEGLLNFLIPMYINHLNLGRGVIGILPEGYSPDNFCLILKNFVDNNQINRQMTIFDSAIEDNGTDNSSIRQVFDTTIKSTFNKIWNRVNSLKKMKFNPIFYHICINKLINMYEEKELLRALSDHMTHVKGSEEDITVSSISEGQEIIKKVGNMADTHWKIRLLHKALAIYGVKPESEFQLVRNDTSKGYVTLTLTPLV